VPGHKGLCCRGIDPFDTRMPVVENLASWAVSIPFIPSSLAAGEIQG